MPRLMSPPPRLRAPSPQLDPGAGSGGTLRGVKRRRATERLPWALVCLATAAAGCQGFVGLGGRGAADATADAQAAAASDAPSDAAGDAPADAPERPRGDATPCPAPTLRVSGAVDRYVVSDVSPDAGTFAASSPRALAADAQGGAYLAGACMGCGPVPRGAVWRVLTATGQSDASWGAAGRAFDGDETDFSTEYWSVAVDEAGRVLAGGYARVGSFHWPAVARFTAGGAPDRSFNGGGRISVEPRRFGRTVSNGFVMRAVSAGDGVLVVGVDESPTDRPAARALLARLRALDGTLDPAFGEAGTLLREDLRGCFDVRPDGEGSVALCQSSDDRPALLRLDARGRERPWSSGVAVALHPAAPRGLHARVLLRDSAGAWLAVGSATRDYNDGYATPAVVRFTALGEADLSYGLSGLAQVSGVRQTPRFTFASAAALACDDRLLVGANLDARPVVAVLDREGRLARDVGERGHVLLPQPPGATVAALTGVALSHGGDAALVLTNFQPAAFSLQSLAP